MYRVILAEDEPLVRMGIKSMVDWEKLEMQVVAECSDGEEAWKACEAYRPDLLITDIRTVSYTHLSGVVTAHIFQKQSVHAAAVDLTDHAVSGEAPPGAKEFQSPQGSFIGNVEIALHGCQRAVFQAHNQC